MQAGHGSRRCGTGPRRVRYARPLMDARAIQPDVPDLLCRSGIISVAQPEIRSEFGLTLGQLGLVFAAFTWTYALGQVPVGWLGDRLGPKKVLNVLITPRGIRLDNLVLASCTARGPRRQSAAR